MSELLNGIFECLDINSSTGVKNSKCICFCHFRDLL